MPNFIGNGRVAGLSSLRTTSYPLSMLRRRFTLSWNSTWLHLCLIFASLPRPAAASVNVSIPNTSPEIVYTPFLCNSTFPANDPDCKGAWNATQIGGIATVSTDGPDPDGLNIVPQMFMTFRASALYMSTSVVSNATANFTVSSPTTTISRLVDSAAGLVALVNLVETDLTTLTITFVPGSDISQLDIGSILVTVTDPTETASFLPTMSLPPSMSLPTFLPTSTASSSSSASASPSSSSTSTHSLSHRAQIAEALGLCLGLGVGLSIIAGAVFFWWRRRRRLQAQNNSWF